MIGKILRKTIAPNVLYAKNEKIYPAYISKCKSNREKKQANILMISNREGWHYIAVKNYLHITSKHHHDFYCLSCLHSFATEKNP